MFQGAQGSSHSTRAPIQRPMRAMRANPRSSRPSIAPAQWWWIRLTIITRHELPVALRTIHGAPTCHGRMRFIIVLPGPPGSIIMSTRRAIEGLSCPTHCIGHLVAQVLVGVTQAQSLIKFHMILLAWPRPTCPECPRSIRSKQAF